jgi:hypothetical protein
MKGKNETLVISEFKGNEISFNWDNEDLMVNATEMAKAFGKRVRDFSENDSFIIFKENIKKSTKFLEYVQRKRAKFGPFNGGEIVGISNINLDNFIIEAKKGRHGGTYMYRTLAIKFAAWLSPEFEIWIYETIENLLFSEKSHDIINYIHKYPQERYKKSELEEELKEARSRANYFQLEEEGNSLISKISYLKEEQRELAIKSLIDDQGDFFKDSRKDLYDQYVGIQTKVNKLEAELKSILNKKAVINERLDIKEMRDSVKKHTTEMKRLKRNINV